MTHARLQDTPSRALIAERTAQINAQSDRLHARCDRWAAITVALAAGAGLAWSIATWLTPCDAAALCSAVVTPTRLSPWARLRVEAEHALLRLRLAVRAWHLRHKLAAAEFDLLHLPEDIQAAQEQLEYTRLHAETLRLQLEDCRLAARRH